MRLNIHEGSLSFYMVFPEIKYFFVIAHPVMNKR